MSNGHQIRVRPNNHGKDETCPTGDYDAFISRNPDLRDLFKKSEYEADELPATPTPEPEPTPMQDPDSLIPAPVAPPDDALLDSLHRIRSVKDEIARLEGALATKRTELLALQKDARALRSLLDEVLDIKPPPPPPVATTRSGGKQESRARAIVEWARNRPDPTAILVTTDVATAMKDHPLFTGIGNLPVALRPILEGQPCFKKLAPGVYALA